MTERTKQSELRDSVLNGVVGGRATPVGGSPSRPTGPGIVVPDGDPTVKGIFSDMDFTDSPT